MNDNDFKCIIGETHSGTPAVIRFFGPVNAETTRRFNEEFLWLQNCIRPSKILVLINSEGGSVLSGMATFSVINSCPIDTHCVVEGLAASMGSVIWAAGTKLFMHDYSILMLHNPFFNSEDAQDETTKSMIQAFRAQLETIYTKRFGLDKKTVRKIMDGEGECDGTYLTATEAVKAGILPAKNVIKTSEQVRADIGEKLKSIEGKAEMRDFLTSACTKEKESQLIENTLSILEQNTKTDNNRQVMNEKELTFDSVVAQLGMAKDSPVSDVPGRVAELVKAEVKLKEAEDECKKAKCEKEDLKIKLKGKEAEAKNLATELEQTKAQLEVFKKAEEAKKAAHIDALVEAAVKEGKISADDKSEWVSMAQANLSLAEKTLASIAPREVISKEIANDPANVDAAEASMKSTMQELEEKIKAAVGDITFKKF